VHCCFAGSLRGAGRPRALKDQTKPSSCSHCLRSGLPLTYWPVRLNALSSFAEGPLAHFLPRPPYHPQQANTLLNEQGAKPVGVQSGGGGQTRWARPASGVARPIIRGFLLNSLGCSLDPPPRSQVPSNVIKRAHPTRLGRPLGP
jgi:hypothetical protein